MKGSFYGTSREDEELKLKEVNRFAKERIQKMRARVSGLQQELGDLREVYDLDEKEGLALWFNKDSRYKQVRQDLLKAERSGKKPYFGRIDFDDVEEDRRETYYIGKTSIGPDPAHPVVLDWRAPVSSAYYEQNLGLCRYRVPLEGVRQIDLKRKRTYEIDGQRLVDYFDTEVVANDELLTRYLSKSKQTVLNEIIATIQQEQNDVIRKNPRHNVLIQGSAGSGKTTVAMHRISYILYNYEQEFQPRDFYIIGSNKVLLNYITGVLPDLDVYDISQLTMEELLVSLLHDEWDKNIHNIRKVKKTDTSIGYKGTEEFFQRLVSFASRKKKELFIAEDIIIPQTKHVMLGGKEIREYVERYEKEPLYEIQEFLTQRLMERVEQEVASHGHIYDVDDKRKALMHYQRYFKRLRFRQSVFELYEEFLNSSEMAEIPYVKNTPDIYDLAALCYLRRALKETEDIHEASHLVIDEAQDFGISIYEALNYCLSRCTYTIMGDVAQNINFGCGMGDWEQLKRLLLPDPYDYFGILKKSYRNTIEISSFANDILKHGSFALYPVEPLIRNGDEVHIAEAADENALRDKLLGRIDYLKNKGYETIGLICVDEDEVKSVTALLEGEVDIRQFSEEDTEFSGGITVLSVEYAKGLEFDAVILANASKENYPSEDRYCKLLYVASTRALHDLSVFYIGELTGLVKDPIPEGRKNPVFEEDTFHKTPNIMEEDYRTRAEIAKDIAAEGDKDMRLRDVLGPRRIDPASNNTHKVGMASVIPKAPPKLNAAVKVPIRPGENTASSKSKTGKATPGEFGRMPEGTSLTPAGHGTINNSVRWITASKAQVVVTGNYGILTIQPLSDSSARIVFAKEAASREAANSAVRFTSKESREELEIALGKLTIKVNKKSGALSFERHDGRKLLSENPSPCRQFFEAGSCCWDYMAFHKEILKAYDPIRKNWLDVSSCARYISSSESVAKENSILMSMKGYQLEFPSQYKVLLCTVSSMDPYIRFEDSDCIEYIFRLANT